MARATNERNSKLSTIIVSVEPYSIGASPTAAQMKTKSNFSTTFASFDLVGSGLLSKPVWYKNIIYAMANPISDTLPSGRLSHKGNLLRDKEIVNVAVATFSTGLR